MSEGEGRTEDDINYPDYERLMNLLREANRREDWDTADKLTPVVSELAEEIGRNQGLPGVRPDIPIYRKWDKAWTELREAQAKGDMGKTDRLYSQIVNLATAIDFMNNKGNRN